ncbi:hypothetical protein SLNSH_01325 [Alsobacter soli]|uniref:Uncharacterized protein n=2 Tax=Alsobacter soli TaxID=2109933 RepID=A0A2T1HZI6_9HYPH|nr:hypothetical protein SLNSH_01325 [Alsobacter soli]
MRNPMKWAVALALVVAALLIAVVTPTMFGHAPKAPPNAPRYPVGTSPNADVPPAPGSPGSAVSPGSSVSPPQPAAPARQ